MFSSPEDAALLDEVLTLACAGRPRPQSAEADSRMTVKSILDTNILSDYLKGFDGTRRDDRYNKEHGVFSFTSVTVFEIVSGLSSRALTGN